MQLACILTDCANEVGENHSGAEIRLQVGDDDAGVELLQIMVRPVRVDLSTISRTNHV